MLPLFFLMFIINSQANCVCNSCNCTDTYNFPPEYPSVPNWPQAPPNQINSAFLNVTFFGDGGTSQGSGTSGYTSVKAIYLYEKMYGLGGYYVPIKFNRASGSYTYFINWTIGPFASAYDSYIYSKLLTVQTMNTVDGVNLSSIEIN